MLFIGQFSVTLLSYAFDHLEQFADIKWIDFQEESFDARTFQVLLGDDSAVTMKDGNVQSMLGDVTLLSYASDHRVLGGENVADVVAEVMHRQFIGGVCRQHDMDMIRPRVRQPRQTLNGDRWTQVIQTVQQ